MSSIPSKPCPLPAGSKVFTYARDSGGDTQERSVDEQIRLYDAYAEQHGLIIAKHFSDRARPGSSMVGRSGLEQLLAEARRQPRRADGIIVWSPDRLSRNQTESQYIKSFLRLVGYEFVFLSGDIPDAGEFTPIFEVMFEWKAARDLKKISEDSKRGLRDVVTRRKSDGSYEGFMPGLPPRGYKGVPVVVGTKRDGKPRVNQRWVKDPAWWGKCRQAWRLRAAGWTAASVHRKLRLFRSAACYSTFFANPIYKGELHYGGMVLKDFVPRMIDDATWSAVQRIRATLKRHAPLHSNSKRLFVGLAYCAACGEPLRAYNYHRTGRKAYEYYGCTGREKKTCKAPMIPVEPFEHEALEKICGMVLTPETLRKMADALRRQRNRSAAGAGETASLLQKDLKQTERSIRNLVASGQAAPLSEALGKALTEQESKADELRARIAELQQERIRTPEIPEYSEEALADLARRFRESIRGPTEESRMALRSLVVKIIVEKKKAVIYCAFPEEETAADEGGGSVYLRMRGAPDGLLPTRRIVITWKNRSEGKQARNEMIRVGRRSGEPLRELAQAFGLTPQRIDQISHKNNSNQRK